MAALTPDSYEQLQLSNGNRLTKATFGTSISNTDTWDSGIQGFVSAAWKPDSISAEVTFADPTAGVFTFAAIAADNTGQLWVEHADY